jgi:hypothetical protein
MVTQTILRTRHGALHKHSVIGWFLGAMAWRTCGRDCAASGMGATTQRKKLAYNNCVCTIKAFVNVYYPEQNHTKRLL